MSIFDVIKYPISEPPTKEELEALPDDLYNYWCVREFGYSYSRNTIHRYLSGYNPSNVIMIKQLRQMIEDYDEPI
jgi:hypothetical protein